MKLTAYILILALFFASVGTSLFFFPELGHIRTSMREQMEKQDNSIELIFTKEAYAHLDWTQKEKEFCYRSRMYDVASVKTDSGRVLVFCFFDKKETGLRQKLKDFFSPSSDKNLPLRQVVKVLSQKYVAYAITTFSGFNNFLLLSHKPYLFSLSVFENELADPPPKA